MNVKKQVDRLKGLERYKKSICVFVFVMLSGLLAWLIYQAVRVFVLKQSFYSDMLFGSYDWDYYMDYFNVNNFWFFEGANPYTSEAMSSYPPLALLIARFFALFGDYSAGSIEARASLGGIISYYVMFLFFTILSALALITCGKRRGFSVKTMLVVSLALIFSLPYIFLFERGNYLVIVITAIAWFFAWYDSEKRWQRELALVFLAIAAGIKIYPALLAAIFLKERRFADFFKTVVYTVALFFLPFLFFSGGFSNIGVFLHNLLDFQGKGQASDHNYSMPTFFFYFAQMAHDFKLTEVPAWVLKIGGWSSYLILIVGLFFSLLSDKSWKTLGLVTLAIIFFPAPSYVYSACMLLPVVAMFLLVKDKTRKDYVYLGLFLVMLIPTQFGYMVTPQYIPIGLNWGNFFQHVAMMTMFWMLVYDSAKNGIGMLKDWKQKRIVLRQEPV